MRLTLSALCLLALMTPGVLAQNQWNQPGQGQLIVNSVNNPAQFIQPVTLFTGNVTTLRVEGAPSMPFALFAAPRTVTPGAAVPGNQFVDLELATMFNLFTGFDPGIFQTDNTGAWNLAFTLGAGTTLGSRIAVQGIVRNPSTAAGFALTATADCTVAQGATVLPVPLGDNGSRQLNLAQFGIGPMPFYDQNFTSLFVNADGNLTFQAGSGNFVANPTVFHSGPPRVAGFWCDLNPAIGGNITATLDPNGAFGPSVRVDYNRLPEWNNTGSLHTFSITMFQLTGDIQVQADAFNLGAIYDLMVGIAPGNNRRPVGSAVFANPVDFTTLTPAGPAVGTPLASVWEWFGLTTMVNYTQGFNNPYDLSGRTVTFTAVGAGFPNASYVSSTL